MSKGWKLATKKEVESRDGRPENIELVCPIQFGKMFTTSGVKGNKRLLVLDEIEKDNPELDIEEKADEIDKIANSNQSIQDDQQVGNLQGA